MQKNTEHILNRDDVGTAILQHLTAFAESIPIVTIYRMTSFRTWG